MPAFRGWGHQEQWHEEEGDPITPSRKDPFLGPVIVLTGPETFSAAEDFVVVLHASKRATLVGERTGGSTGHPLMIDLPGGVTGPRLHETQLISRRARVRGCRRNPRRGDSSHCNGHCHGSRRCSGESRGTLKGRPHNSGDARRLPLFVRPLREMPRL